MGILVNKEKVRQDFWYGKLGRVTGRHRIPNQTIIGK